MLFIHISLIFLHLVTIYSHKNLLHLPQAALVYSPVNSFAITPIGRWHKIKKKQILISASFIGSFNASVYEKYELLFIILFYV